jgi:hypothetical protein
MQRIIVTGKSLILICALLIYNSAYSQKVTQTLRGSIFDNTTNETLPGATIIVLNTNPVIGTISGIDGNFTLKNVPVGRQNIKISMVGYRTYIENELLISTGKERVLEIALQTSIQELEEIVVQVRKDVPINSMTSVSSKQFTVEETQRYAGGLDDPSRLVSSFAGVAVPSISSNGISVRGNNPQGLLWRIEGVEVPNPNHFANLSVFGGGALTALSSQTLGNSDFLTGAFPAEYGNASSGVFDMKMKTGNTNNREYTFQLGALGTDFATEGPFKKGGKSSYLINYRYSTLALLAPILPDDAGSIKYQDLAFKFNFPTKKAGTFSLWGVGALDGQDRLAKDSVDWEADYHRDNSETEMYMAATGLSHKIGIGEKTFLNTSLSASGNGLEYNEKRLDYNLQEHPYSNIKNNFWRFIFSTKLNHRFGNNHNNRTGFNFNRLGYNLDVEQSISEGTLPVTMSKADGNSNLIQAYSQSKINILPKLSANIGLHVQYFTLNNNLSIEPRAGLKYYINTKNSIAFAYGLHTRLEALPVYFAVIDGSTPNEDLELMKSHHYVFSYDVKLNENLRLSIEPYYQKLTDIPVAPNSYVSTINLENGMFFNDALISEGVGRNIGIDITFERFLNKGLYYLLTASVFDSKYTAADGVERNTRFNKNYVFNALVGKEWSVGMSKNNIISANLRLNYLGGNRAEAIDIAASDAARDVVYGETDGNVSFENKYDDMPVFSFTFSYRKNKPKHSSVWSLQILNLTATKEYNADYYNLKTNQVVTSYDGIILPNISYRIEF